MTNLFRDYRNYRSRLVDSPVYKWLQQEVVDEKELKRMKQKEYQKEYYKKNKERIRKYQRAYWRKGHETWNHRGDMIWNQKRVYDYLLEQYRGWKDSPRGTEIARALGITENSVYTAIFNLTKKWYVGRGSYGRYLLLKFPDGDKPVNNLQEGENSEKLFVTTEENYNKLRKENEELKNEVKEWKKQKEELELQVKNSVYHLESLMKSNDSLERKNLSLCGQIEELKWVVKVLLKYFQ